MNYQPVEVTHPDDPACPGHDINTILAERSRELGYCLCIHPFMTVIDFSGLGCDWCGQPVTEQAMTSEAKEIRTQAVHAALAGSCRDHAPVRDGGP